MARLKVERAGARVGNLLNSGAKINRTHTFPSPLLLSLQSII